MNIWINKLLFALLLIFTFILPYRLFALVNGDFEADPIGNTSFTGWNTYSGNFSVISGKRTGGSGIKYANIYNGNGQPATITQTLSEISANGNTWRLIGWFRVASGSGSPVNFGFIGSQSPFGTSFSNVTIPSTATTWTAYTVNHSWTSANYSDGYRDVQVLVSGYPFYVDADDITVQNLTNAQGFTNGDFEADGIGEFAFTGWNTYSGGFSVVSGKRTGGAGTRYANIGNFNSYPAAAWQTVGGITTNGNTWRLIGWLRAGVGNTQPISFGFFGSESPFGGSSTNKSILSTATTWTAYTVNHSWTFANSTDGYRDVRIVVPGQGPDYADVDDVTVINQTVPILDWCFY